MHEFDNCPTENDGWNKSAKRVPQNGGIMISIEISRDLMSFYAARGKEMGVSAYQAMRNVLYGERTKMFKDGMQ